MTRVIALATLFFFGIPIALFGWRAQRVLRSDFPYSLDYEPMSPRSQALTRQLPAWAQVLSALAAVAVLTVVVGALFALFD